MELDDLLDGGEIMQMGALVIAQVPRLVKDDVGQLRNFIRHRLQLADLILVLDDGEPHTGMVEHVGNLVGHRVGVNRDRNGLERLRRAAEARGVVLEDGGARQSAAGVSAEFTVRLP